MALGIPLCIIGTAGVSDLSAQLRREFGRRFREARLSAKLTQADVSKATGVNTGHISEIERGLQNVTMATMTLLAGAVGMEIAVALTPKPTKRKPTKRNSATPSGPYPT